MPEYVIDIPDELVEVVVAQGYSVDDYIDIMLIKPLTKRMKVGLEKKEVERARVSIDNSVRNAREKVKIKKNRSKKTLKIEVNGAVK